MHRSIHSTILKDVLDPTTSSTTSLSEPEGEGGGGTPI